MDDGQWAPFVPLVWKSHKQKRKVPSTLAAESMAAGEALGSLDWVRSIFEKVGRSDFRSPELGNCCFAPTQPPAHGLQIRL